MILLTQPFYWQISRQEMQQALSAEDLSGAIDISIDTREEINQALLAHDWISAKHALKKMFQERLAPHQGAPLRYFGSAPISTGIYLGYLVSNWWPVRVFQQHHRTKEWSPAQSQAPRIREVSWPTERDRTYGEAVIRVSTSHVVEPAVTRQLIANPVLELDLGLAEPSEDALSTHDEIALIAAQFKSALDLIADRFSGVHTIHLFASVQTGVAFLLGTQINKGKHPKIQTYHYERSAQPNHRRAILINGEESIAARTLRPQEITQAKEDRARLAQSLRQLSARSHTTSWLESLGLSADVMPSLRWSSLPALQDTPLLRTSVDEETTQVSDSFSLDLHSNRWQLDDHWLAHLSSRVSSPEDRCRALRLLVLHEAIHRGPQRLTRTSSHRIGRFARVVEEMDYLADVWAMLHEVVFYQEGRPHRELLLSLIKIATEAMWAFDDHNPTPQEIQIRRLHRYLVWYWQYLSIEAEPAETSLSRLASLLSEHPCIEVVGPEIAIRDGRTFYVLGALKEPEIALYQGGKLYRHGSRSGLSIEALFDAVSRRDGVGFIDSLRGAFDQTVR
jgi:hypothetical protein